MYIFLVVTALLQLIGLIVLTLVLLRQSKKVRKYSRAHLACKEKLDSFSDIADAEQYLESCTQRASQAELEIERLNAKHTYELDLHEKRLNDVKVKLDEKAAHIGRLKDRRQKLESIIKQYQDAVGRFKSITQLKRQLGELQRVVGVYNSAAELKITIDKKKKEIQECAEAMQVAATAQSIQRKVQQQRKRSVQPLLTWGLRWQRC